MRRLCLFLAALAASAYASADPSSVHFGPGVIINGHPFASGPTTPGADPGNAERDIGPLHCRVYGNGTDVMVEGRTMTCAPRAVVPPPVQ